MNRALPHLIHTLDSWKYCNELEDVYKGFTFVSFISSSIALHVHVHVLQYTTLHMYSTTHKMMCLGLGYEILPLVHCIKCSLPLLLAKPSGLV